jgi:hypothetical protein
MYVTVSVAWVRMVQDSENLWKVVKTLMKIQVSQNAGNFLDAVSRSSLLHVVIWLVGWLVSCRIPGFRRNVFEIVSLLRCYAA